MIAKYDCSQDELYEGAELLAVSLGEELAAMAAFKAKYDAVFVTAFGAAITAARNLPDDAQRSAAAEVKRIVLKALTDGDVKTKLGALRLYIRDAYSDEEERAVRMTEAGFDDYDSAMKYNWEVLKGEMKDANDFITAHSAELLANDNMPAGFAAAFAALKTNVDGKVTDMLNTRENTKQGTSEKIKANNDLYKMATDICGDGQHVFMNDEAKRAQFVWESIMDVVSPPGAAGFRFDVKEKDTNIPLPGTVVTIQKEGGMLLTQVADANAKGYFPNLEAGFYNVTVTLSGYEPSDGAGEIEAGVTKFEHIHLTKLP